MPLTVTALYAGSLALWFLMLSYRVVGRRRAGIFLGDGADPGMQISPSMCCWR
ncbi:MAG: hypothetical protein JSW48_07315 [Betaproteobacteria bacterium]|jgi:uncharacterized membrane protein YecN with MAPEG domain|nr:MAG: hypothetical protein JSW48_07315 [Betaproteobacteria bacterium]